MLEIKKIHYPNLSVFPDPSEADDEGLLAQGGNLSSDLLLDAYSKGIFPWFNEDSPILWWSPNPRMILFPKKLVVSHSLKQYLKKGCFVVSFDTCFKDVIEKCANVDRKGEKGTWITDEMQKAYIKLHELGYAHSVEVFKESKLVGGLYGVSLGKSFFGESMFHSVNNASKIALCFLVQRMLKWEFDFIDTQIYTEHLESLGATIIQRDDFLNLLQKSLMKETYKGKWGID